MSKNMKMHTQLTIGFSIITLTLIMSLYFGYTTAAQIVTVEDQAHYLSSYGYFTAVEFLIMILVTTGIAVTMTRKIRMATAEVKKVTDALAVGKIDIQTEYQYNDEFGGMIMDLQKAIENIRYQAQIAQEVSEGNMTVEVRPKSEDDVMGIALKNLVLQNKNSIMGVQESAFQVTTSASQVASASEALAQGSTEQASAIEEITASIDDVAERTKQNAEQANEATQLMGNAIEDVKKGNAEMQKMVIAMDEINKASESISKIIKVIDDIAFQTNILALNAAVEAARAGEAGKGFAVVAEEVRNLAAKSAQAAAETAELIEDSIAKVAVGSKIANETAVALEEITNVVKQSETIITEIAEASNYQATAIAQIDQAIEQVSQVVQTNSATSQECAAASVELSSQASHVREMLSVYNLGNNSQMSMSAERRYSAPADRNEQIISLKGNFGKY